MVCVVEKDIINSPANILYPWII